MFGLTRPGLEPTNYRTRGEHANHYATDAICKCYQVGSLMTLPLPDVGVVIMIMILHTVSLSNIDIYLYLFKKKIVIVNLNVLWSPSLLCLLLSVSEKTTDRFSLS